MRKPKYSIYFPSYGPAWGDFSSLKEAKAVLKRELDSFKADKFKMTGYVVKEFKCYKQKNYK